VNGNLPTRNDPCM